MTLPKIIFNVLAFVVLMAGCKAVHNNSDLNDERNKTKRAAKNAEAVTDGDSEEAGVNVDTAKTLDLKLGRDLLTAFKSYTRNPAQTEVSIDRVTGTYSVGRSGSKEKISC
ncbi:MAG: hypothetical protein NTV34_11845, partial [Proteobacteria bacterium]|nr:hypothetical protein [Pseudomonadota bacterium]